MTLHPATQIVVWCLLVALLPQLKYQLLLTVAGMLMLGAAFLSGHKFMQLLRRTRWVMLSLWLVYAWSTPGQAVYEPWEQFSPTFEGLNDGLVQLLRLLAALSSLAVLLDKLHRMQLIAGLYVLCAPLQWFGGLRERFAVRLALTLQYAEVAMLRGRRHWRETLDQLFEPQDEIVHQLELSKFRFGAADALVLGLMLAVLGMFLGGGR